MIEFITLIFVVFVAFILWRWTSVGRGVRKRDEILLKRLEPVASRIESSEEVSADEINEIAKSPEIRHILFSTFQQIEKAHLLPENFSSTVDQGESSLAYWMMHPNEFGEAPDQIEFIETIERQINGEPRPFHVYRFKMQEGHWSAEDQWQIGLAGPMDDTKTPYEELPGAFSRAGDFEGTCTPIELVDWYVSMLRQKGMIN